MLKRTAIHTLTVLTLSLSVTASHAQGESPADTKAACVESFEAAQKLRSDRKLVEARKEMIACGQSACPEAVRVKCVEWLPDLERALPSLLVAVRDRNGRDATDVEVLVDGKVVKTKLDGSPIPINPGAHKLKVKFAEEKPLEQEIVVQEGEQYRKITFNYHRRQPAPRANAVPPPWMGPPQMAAPIPPAELPYEDGQPIPDGYVVDTRIRKGLVIGGAVTLGTLWALSVIAGAIVQESGKGTDAVPLYFPVAGPFVAIGTLSASSTSTAFLVIDGVVQTAGAAMFIAGLAAEQSYLRYTGPTASGFELEAIPNVGPGGAGLTLRARF